MSTAPKDNNDNTRRQTNKLDFPESAGLVLLPDVLLPVEVGEEAEEECHDGCGDGGELPGVAAGRDAENHDQALAKECHKLE